MSNSIITRRIQPAFGNPDVSKTVTVANQRTGHGEPSDFLSVPLAVSGLTVLTLLLSDYLTTSIADKTAVRVNLKYNERKPSGKCNYYA
jgi:hypothetical protein